MTVKPSALRETLAALFEDADRIEKKYPDGQVVGDDFDKLTEILTKARETQVELSKLDEIGDRRATIQRGLEAYARGQRDKLDNAGGGVLPKGLADAFLGSEQYEDLSRKGAFNGNIMPQFQFSAEGPQFGLKDLTYTTGTGTEIGIGDPFESRVRVPGFIPLEYDKQTLLSLMPRTPINEELVEWIKEVTATSNADMVAEATASSGNSGLLPESGPFEFETDTMAVKDLGHHAPITNRMLRAAPQLRGYINDRLLFGLNELIETQLRTGDNTGQNILGWDGFGAQTHSQGSDTIVDALHKALTKVRVTGRREPFGFLMHPNTWQFIRLMKDGIEGYVFGPPSSAGGMQLWGKPVLLDPRQAETTVWLPTLTEATVYDRQRNQLASGYIDNQLIRGLNTLMATAALCQVVWRPSAFLKATVSIT